MAELSKQFLMIFLLKGKPQEIPYSKALLLMLLILSFTLRNVTNIGFINLIKKYLSEDEIIQLSLWSSSFMVAVSILLMYACVYSVLTFYNKQNRLVQVFSVMLGIDIILAVCFVVWMGLFYISPLALLLFILLLYWQFMIHIHIFVHSFDITLIKAGAFALIYILLQHNISEWLMNLLVRLE